MASAGFGAASAAAASTLPPARPLEVDPSVLLILAGLIAMAAETILDDDDRESYRLSVLTGVILAAALVGAVLHELHHPLGNRRLFAALVLVSTASLLQALRRPPGGDLRPAPPASAGVGVIGGRWVLLRPLPGADSGGFSDPWLGVDLNHGRRRVVVKLESKLPARRDESRRRLEREQRMLAPVQSRWVVQVHDGGYDRPSQRQYVVLDHHPAGSLAKHLERTIELRLAWIMQVVVGVLQALVVLHEELPQPMAHRDVTPRNVLLRRDLTTPLLCDFGTARLLGRPGRTRDDQVTIGMVFSRYYAAPELVDEGFRNRWDPTPWSDLYATGAMLYEMLTGRPPYWREEREADLEFGRLVLDPGLRPAPPTWVNPDLPSVVDELIAWSLAFRPDDRPPTGRLLLPELRAVARLHGDLRIPLAELRDAHIPVASGTTTTCGEP
jgi:serine/threonine protein kinase